MMPSDLERDDLAERLNDELRRRVQVMPIPPKTFDALGASDEQLRYFGFPPKPKDEAALVIWKNIVTAVRVPLDVWIPIPLPAFPAYQIGFNRFAGSGHQETSLNWSGTAVEAEIEAGGSFAQIYGQWQLPAASLPANADPQEQYRCSIWIGLDGHAATSMSMPQVGTTVSICVGDAAPTYEAWFQWWARGYNILPVPITGVALREQDLIACSIEVRDATHVGISITNLTLNEGPPLLVVAAPSPGSKTLSVEGLSAEWIAERPTDLNDSTKLHPLPDFDRVTFGETRVQTEPPRRMRGLSPSRLIRMIERKAEHSVVLSRSVLDSAFPHDGFDVGPGVEKDMGG
jgi:hypothetical protein